MKNEKILNELEKSGEQFSNLFVQNNAEFVEIPNSGTSGEAEEHYVARVNNVTMVAFHDSKTASWKFKPIIPGYKV